MTDTFLDSLQNGKRHFRNLQVTDANLRGMDAADCSFIGCQFFNVDFTLAMLEGLHTTDCTFAKCIFARARLSESIFERTSFYQLSAECSFEYADLRLGQFTECDIRLASFEKARLFRSAFEKTNATGASFFRADFNQNVKIVGSIFRLADLRDADLCRCDLHKTVFEQADLRHARLNETNLTECNFAGANVSHMEITGADMRGANIAQLDIRTLDFTGVTMYAEQGRVLLENAGITLVDRDSGQQAL